MSAVILFSGGLDSTAAVGVAVEDHHKKIYLLSLDYGSLHGEAERNAAWNVTHDLREIYPDVEFLVPEPIKLPAIFAGGHSALMGDVPMPSGVYQDLKTQGPSSTVVPFRNANFISIATTIAERDGYDMVYIAVHASDHNRWAYPDCSPEFIGAMMNAVYVGTMHKVRLVAPFLWMTKAEVVRKGYDLGAPLSKTWSCYRGGKFHCGTCPTCIERHKAFIEAVKFDLTQYDVDPIIAEQKNEEGR